MSVGPQPAPPKVGARTDGCERKKGSHEGEKTWVFPPRELRAEALCRTHSRSALSERFLGMIVFKDINIFREIALSEQSFGDPIKRF